MKTSAASSVSAHASANDRKIVLRAGTYVTGMSAPICVSVRSFGTAMSSVSADPPKRRRSNSTISCRSAPSARATRRAASISRSWRCPYRNVNAYVSKPSRRAIASVVVESTPPLSKTTAFGLLLGMAPTNPLPRTGPLPRPANPAEAREVQGGSVPGAQRAGRDVDGDGIYRDLPENRTAGFRQRGDRVYARRALSRIHGPEVPSLVVPGRGRVLREPGGPDRRRHRLRDRTPGAQSPGQSERPRRDRALRGGAQGEGTAVRRRARSQRPGTCSRFAVCSNAGVGPRQR